MIRSLYQEAISNFGRIQPASEKAWANRDSIGLHAGVTQVFQTQGPTWLNRGSGMRMTVF